MSKVVFVRTRHHYDSYTDFWKLVELSEFPTCYVDELDPASDTTYIITPYNDEWAKGWDGARARIIWWDIEWHVNGDFPHVPGVSEVWASDRSYADLIDAKYVPLGSHAGLATGYEDPPAEKLYDVAVLAYLTNRRVRLIMGGMWEGIKIDGLRELGVSIAPQGWGQERHNALKQTRLMLHIHQHDNVATIAPQRIALAAAYSLPVLCEQVEDWGIFGYSHLLRSDYPNLPRQAKMWTENGHQQLVADCGRALHQLLCVEKTFRTNVEAAL